MKIGFIISSKGHGRGGHFYSLRATAEALSSRLTPVIVNVGLTESPVLNSFNGHKIDVLMGRNNMRRHAARIREALSSVRLDVIHSFDLDALYFARTGARALGVPLVHTKCGGGAPATYFPCVDDLVVYSNEDLAWFRASARHRRGRITLIPNRVISVPQDRDAIRRLRTSLPNDKLIVLRICRIGAYYRKSLVQAAQLVRKLSSDGLPIHLLVVGVVQDSNVQNEIEQLARGLVTFATDEEFTVNAARVIDVADAVIGTGRGFMEAAVLGKLMLAPAADASIPLLVETDRVDVFLMRNFSERVTVGSFNEREELERIRVACTHHLNGELGTRGLPAYARAHFDIASSLDEYCSLYETVTYRNPVTLFDFAMHTVLTTRRLKAARRNHEYGAA